MLEAYPSDYDFRFLAIKYSKYLPPGCPYDWEDLYQEMCLKEVEYHSPKSLHWAAQHVIRNEWVRCQPRDVDWAIKRSPRLDVICEAYRLIQRWPWLLGLLLEGSQAALAKQAGVQKAAIGKRINHIRADLGIAKRYRDFRTPGYRSGDRRSGYIKKKRYSIRRQLTCD